jgi:hypothetical protein
LPAWKEQPLKGVIDEQCSQETQKKDEEEEAQEAPQAYALGEKE